MAQANIDLVRSIYADWERGDFGVTSCADPALEFVTVGGVFGSSAVRGLEATRPRWREFLADWQDFHAVAESYHELDDEREHPRFRWPRQEKRHRRRPDSVEGSLPVSRG